jgi:DNA mismatch endonuclease Vsr
MADQLSPPQRSAFMALIRGENTRPELVVRQLLHSMGYRYRVHSRWLPGRPDVAFTTRRKVIFVHGCFWHHHKGCAFAHVPKSRSEYWAGKFERNRARDERNLAQIRAAGWEAALIWECEIKDEGILAARLVEFLGPPRWPT